MVMVIVIVIVIVMVMVIVLLMVKLMNILNALFDAKMAMIPALRDRHLYFSDILHIVEQPRPLLTDFS
jgi:hypothetical protein